MARLEFWGYREDGETLVNGAYARIDAPATDDTLWEGVERVRTAFPDALQVHYYVDGKHHGISALLLAGDA